MPGYNEGATFLKSSNLPTQHVEVLLTSKAQARWRSHRKGLLVKLKSKLSEFFTKVDGDRS